MTLDPRLHAHRPDLADQRLRGQVEAESFSAGQEARVRGPITGVFKEPRQTASMLTQALDGERVSVFDRRDGWAWVQLQRDNYVGYVPERMLGPVDAAPTHVVSVPATLAYPAPDLKRQPAEPLYCMSEVAVTGIEGDYSMLADGRYVMSRHLARLESLSGDPASVAETFVHAPYLWGGKSQAGIDCSGLVQLSWQLSGRECPRDSDMIEAAIGEPFEPSPDMRLTRNDLVFWKGHVGIMLDAETLIHANGHHMQTVIEPLAEAVGRIARLYGNVTAYHRPFIE